MIERVYNIILWRIYSFLRGTTKLLNGINPFTWLLQIPFIKKFIIKRGGSIEQIEAAADSVTNDPVMGTNILYASRFMALVSIAWLLNGVVFLPIIIIGIIPHLLWQLLLGRYLLFVHICFLLSIKISIRNTLRHSRNNLCHGR